MNFDWATLENLQHITKDNQFLVGGIGTVVFSGVVLRFRALPRQIYNRLYSWYTIHVELNTILYSTRDLYQILDYLEAHTIRRFTKNYSLKDRLLIPGYGPGWARVDGLWVHYSREQINQGYQFGDALKMTFFTRSRERIQRFIESALPIEERTPRLTIVNHGNHLERPLRPWSSVFADASVKQHLREKFLWFANNEQWYIDHGMPYKLVVLIEGKPGVGKSSLITAFASEFELQLEYVSSFYSMSSNCKLDQPFGDDSEPRSVSATPQKVRTLAHLAFNRAIVLEDVDALGELNRQSKDYKASEDGLAIQELLNLMDSGTTPWGLIMFLTTNHPDRLDEALRRPGRIDCTIRLGYLDADTAESMFVSFYGESWRDAFRQFARQYYRPIAGADLQQAFYHHHASDALAALKTILNAKQEPARTAA